MSNLKKMKESVANLAKRLEKCDPNDISEELEEYLDEKSKVIRNITHGVRSRDYRFIDSLEVELDDAATLNSRSKFQDILTKLGQTLLQSSVNSNLKKAIKHRDKGAQLRFEGNIEKAVWHEEESEFYLRSARVWTSQ